jgi:hypothetical protein
MRSQSTASRGRRESATACPPRLKRGRSKNTLRSTPAHRLRRMPPAASASSHWRTGVTGTRRTRQAVARSRRRKRVPDIPIGRCRLQGRSPVPLGESHAVLPVDRDHSAGSACDVGRLPQNRTPVQQWRVQRFRSAAREPGPAMRTASRSSLLVECARVVRWAAALASRHR